MMDMATSPPTTLSSSPSFPFPRPAVIAKDAAYLLVGLPAGVVSFSVLVTGLSLAGGLAITLLGIPMLLLTLIVARAMGDAERWRAGWVLPEGAVRRADRPWPGGLWARTKAAASDLGAWRDTLWGLLLLPIGTFTFTVALTAWSAALGFATSPIWYWALPDDSTIGLLDSHSFGANALRCLIGFALIPVAIWTCRGLADLTGRAARAVLAH
jgi:hypothetical protein